MERIKLTKEEKQVLRLVEHYEQCPPTYPLSTFAACVDSLERKGLVRGCWSSGHELEAVKLSDNGKSYLALNPHLRNPINWAMITAILSVISVTVAIIALFVACKKYN